MTKTFLDETLFGFSNFGHCYLFDIWNFNNSMNFQQSKSPLGIGPLSQDSLLGAD